MKGSLVLTILVAIIILATVTACKKNIEPGNATQTAQYKDCNEYCASQPHTACEGGWTVSGTLPDCTCNFKCTEKTGTTGTGTTETPAPVADKYSISTADRQFSVSVGTNIEIIGGSVTYLQGDANTPPAKIYLRGPGTASITAAYLYIKSGTKPAGLKGVLHDDGNGVFSFPLRGYRGIATIQVDSGGAKKDIGISLALIPK